MKCSIIIPVLNEYHALLVLLPKLFEDNSKHTLELIVCDGHSNDLTKALIKQFQTKLINKPHLTLKFIQSTRGRANQMNAGASNATLDVLLFLHADTYLPDNFLDLIERSGAEWGRFNVRLSGSHFMFRIIEKMMNWRSCVTQVATGDQAIFVKKSRFDQVNGFDDMALMEDIALSKKLRRLSRMTCIKTPLVTSSRRWETHGIIKTVLLMWRFRLAYFMGASPTQLAKKYYPNHSKMKQQALLQVFAKQVLEGFVKTRLSPQLSPSEATEIYRFLLNRILTEVVNYGGQSEIWVAYKNQQQNNLAEFNGHKTCHQQGSDLGDRMSQALQQGLASHEKVVLIGTDCIDLKQQHIIELLDALDTVEMAFLPVTDGGFIAVACRVFDPIIFKNIPWGTSTVLNDVLSNLTNHHVTYHCLEPVRDIDTYDDVMDYPELKKLTS